MKRFLPLVLIVLIASAAVAQSKERSKAASRVDDAATVLDDIMAAPDSGIPSKVIESAQCVAVIPSYLKAAFGIGGQYGRGLASCRTSTGWSAPAFFRVEGGSFGLQIGGQAVDLIMLVMNERGMQAMLNSKFKLGGDVSVAAGPVGREAEANTDWKMRAQVLTYSRARGIFAGISLHGAVISQDDSSTRDFYGKDVPFKDLLTGETPAPSDASPFLTALGKYSGSRLETPPAPKPTQPSGSR